MTILRSALSLIAYIDTATRWYPERQRVWRLFGEWAWAVDKDLFNAIRYDALPLAWIRYDHSSGGRGGADESVSSKRHELKSIIHSAAIDHEHGESA